MPTDATTSKVPASPRSPTTASSPPHAKPATCSHGSPRHRNDRPCRSCRYTQRKIDGICVRAKCGKRASDTFLCDEHREAENARNRRAYASRRPRLVRSPPSRSLPDWVTTRQIVLLAACDVFRARGTVTLADLSERAWQLAPANFGIVTTDGHAYPNVGRVLAKIVPAGLERAGENEWTVTDKRHKEEKRLREQIRVSSSGVET